MLAILLVFYGHLAVAGSVQTLTTSYLQVDLPVDWRCSRNDVEWLCLPQSGDGRSGVIVFTAQQAGPEDTLDGLRSSLKLPKTIVGRGKNAVTSRLEWAKDVRLADGTQWTESLHFNREVEDFYTYYLATVARGLNILVSFSFQKQMSGTFQPTLELIRASLKLIAPLPREDGSAGVPRPLPLASPSPPSATGSARGGAETPMLPLGLITALVAVGAVLVVLLGRRK